MSTSADSVATWLEERRAASNLSYELMAWEDCGEWGLQDGVLARRKGGFFRVIGFDVEDVPPDSEHRHQPLIDQPGPGILGFLGRRTTSGTAEILLQAKTEPGNILGTQIAPTVQATISNYTRVHGGRATPYLRSFLETNSSTVSIDVEQSEQGTAFLGKYNRNMLLLRHGALEEPDTPNLRWFPASDLLRALAVDYSVNTDARSVLVCSNWSDLAPGAAPFSRWRGAGGFNEMLLLSYEAEPGDDEVDRSISPWIAEQRSRPDPSLKPIPLQGMTDWSIESDGLVSDTSGAFVRLFEVSTNDREVASWQQPLFGEPDVNRVVLVCQEREGVLRFLLRAALEPGFVEGTQIGPTAHSLDRRALDSSLTQFALEAGEVVISVNQSEEGGRFFQTINRYEIRLLTDDEQPPLDVNARWLTLADIHRLAQSRGFLTNELRSAISLLLTTL